MIKLEDIVYEQCEIMVMTSYLEEGINFKAKKEFLAKLVERAKDMIKKIMAWFKNKVEKVFKKKNENFLDLLDEAIKKGGPNAKIKVINFIDWGGVLYAKTKHNLLHMSEDVADFLIGISKRLPSETTKFVEDEVKNSELYSTFIDATSGAISDIEFTRFSPFEYDVKRLRKIADVVIHDLFKTLKICIECGEIMIKNAKYDTADLEDSDGYIEHNVTNIIKAATKYMKSVQSVLHCIEVTFYGEVFSIARALSQGKTEIDLQA